MALLKSLMASKKFMAMVLGIVATIAIRAGLDPEMAKEIAPAILKLVVAFILAQGIADHNKEAKKLELAASTTTAVVSSSTSATPTRD